MIPLGSNPSVPEHFFFQFSCLRDIKVTSLEIHIGVLTHYTSGVRNGRFCQELHLHSSAWWADVCQFQFTTLGWLKLVLDDILQTGWSHN